MDIQTIHYEAKEAANKAELDYFEKHGEPAYCGFAWVEVDVSRKNSKEAKLLKHVGFRDSWKPKCVYSWSVGDYATQSMDIKEQGARAYAEVMRKYGIKARACSRAD